MDSGLTVDFDGKQNIIFTGENIKKYPIGGLICEYARFRPMMLKEYISETTHFDDEFTHEAVSEALFEIYNKLLEDYGPVTATLIISELCNYLSDYAQVSEEDMVAQVEKLNGGKDSAVNTFILKDSGYTQFGKCAVGQALLTIYAVWATSFTVFKFSFNMLLDEGEFREDQLDSFWSMYNENSSFQHITFRIVNIEGKLRSLYTIQSSFSLLLFEVAHALEADTNFVKCKNCGEFFVPVGRSDAVYCGYPSPQEPDKLCREIGARNTRARKMKNDIATKEYRRIYMRLKMAIQRHPENKEMQKKFSLLTQEVKRLRKEVKDGTQTADVILEWLRSFEATLNTN